MLLRLSLLAVLVSGCLHYSQEEDDITVVTLHVSAGDSGAFTALEVITSSGSLDIDPIQIDTPALLATNQPARSGRAVGGTDSPRERTVVSDAPISSGSLRNQVFDADVYRFRYGFAVGLVIESDGSPTITGYAQLFDHFQTDGDGDVNASVTLEPATEFEEWGGRGDRRGSDASCFRFATSEEVIYVVHRADLDCDGTDNELDCKPTTFCDPAATSGPARAACVCD